MRSLVVLFLLGACVASIADSPESPFAMDVREATFQANGLELSGLISTPVNTPARGLVIIVHGYGTTNVVNGNQYHALRSHFASAGVASFAWDKPGRGKSEGTFDAQQSVQSSAREVVAAAAYLREQDVAGSQIIGLWGVSRGGWIAPLALAQDRALAFWISVSGVDAKETFGYLLESNWRAEGRTDAEIAKLKSQWQKGNAVVSNGGTYDEFVTAVGDYYDDPFVRFVSGSDGMLSEERFDSWRASWEALSPPLDPETGLMIYVEDFPELLSGLDIPVLALFGEKDTSVDWRSARALYEETIGQNPRASLTVGTFSNGNHNLHVAQTGGFREMLEILKDPQLVPGYYGAMTAWLQDVTR